MKHILTNTSFKRGWLARLLWPVSCCYGLVVRIRYWAYRHDILKTVRFPVRVVVIGNVIAGGGGKTPLVIALAEHVCNQGRQVGIVSRGYGRRSTTPWLEVTAATSPAEGGDEPVLIKRRTDLPVFVARNRVEAVRQLLQAHPETTVVIADDGLQHYALTRDVEVVVFDDRGVGNGWLLPAGPLREPWPRIESDRNNLVLHTGSRPAFDGFTSLRQLSDHAVDAAGQQTKLDELMSQPVIALAAIAQPQAFFDMLRAQGIQPVRCIALPDHDNFDNLDWPSLKGSIVLCTEKDAVKLWAHVQSAPVRFLAVPLVFQPEPAFFQAFDALLANAQSQLPFAHGHETS